MEQREQPAQINLVAHFVSKRDEYHKIYKFITITTFEEETNQLVDFKVIPDEPQKGDIYIRAFRIRKEFPKAQVDVVESTDNTEPSPNPEPIPEDVYLQHKIRDWMIVALSKLNSGKQISNNVFRSIDNLPLTYEQLKSVLDFVIAHPFYRGQQMYLKSSDDVNIVIHGGSITIQDSDPLIITRTSSPNRSSTPETRRDLRKHHSRQTVKSGVYQRRRCNTAPQQNAFAFSVAITTLHKRHQLHVLELHSPPKTMEDFLLSAGRVLSLQDDSSDDTDNESLYQRAFTINGKELTDISAVLNYCMPSLSNATQNWGLATVILSMGEEFF